MRLVVADPPKRGVDLDQEGGAFGGGGGEARDQPRHEREGGDLLGYARHERVDGGERLTFDVTFLYRLFWPWKAPY